MFKGDFFVVDYKVSAQGASYSDIISSDKIRCPNTKYNLLTNICKEIQSYIHFLLSPPITYSTFKRIELPVPKEIQEAYVYIKTNKNSLLFLFIDVLIQQITKISNGQVVL